MLRSGGSTGGGNSGSGSGTSTGSGFVLRAMVRFERLVDPHVRVVVAFVGAQGNLIVPHLQRLLGVFPMNHKGTGMDILQVSLAIAEDMRKTNRKIFPTGARRHEFLGTLRLREQDVAIDIRNRMNLRIIDQFKEFRFHIQRTYTGHAKPNFRMFKVIAALVEVLVRDDVVELLRG